MTRTKTSMTVRISLLAAAVASTVGMSAGAAGAAPAHPTAPAVSPAGKYSYNDSKGDHDEGLTLNSNGTLVFESGCKGTWVTAGSSIAMDINAGCNGSTWIFGGTVSSAGLSSKSHPGRLAEFAPNRTTGTWYAVRV